MLTFTVTESVTVTFDAEKERDAATEHAATAQRWATDAAEVYTRGYQAAVNLPVGWTSPGGARAGEVLLLMLTDRDAAAEAARLARFASVRCDAAQTAQEAAWACDEAAMFARSARFDATTVNRYASYLLD